TGPEPLEHHVGLREDLRRPLAARVPGDDLLSVVQRVVRGGVRARDRVAVGRLDLHDARTQPQELAARVRAGEVASEIRDGDIRERLHARDYAGAVVRRGGRQA